MLDAPRTCACRSRNPHRAEWDQEPALKDDTGRNLKSRKDSLETESDHGTNISFQSQLGIVPGEEECSRDRDI